MIRIVVIVALLLIVRAALAWVCFICIRDRSGGTRMVKALAIRVALSACLIIFLVASYELGWIGENGLR